MDSNNKLMRTISRIIEDAMNQINRGVKIEEEHKRTYALIKRYFEEGRMIPENIFYLNIAKDHVAEDPMYYSKLNKAGL